MNATTWRHRPTEVEAFEWTGDFADLPAEWRASDLLYLDPRGKLIVRTPHGPAKPVKGDYVVKGTAGEFYPVPRAIFEFGYERVAS